MNFGFCQQSALRELHAHGFQLCVIKYKTRTSFHKLSRQRLLEFERMECPLQASPIPQTTLPTKRTYSSTLPSLRRFLRYAFGNETLSFDRFFDLPDEIRLMIYEAVFATKWRP